MSRNPLIVQGFLVSLYSIASKVTDLFHSIDGEAHPQTGHCPSSSCYRKASEASSSGAVWKHLEREVDDR